LKTNRYSQFSTKPARLVAKTNRFSQFLTKPAWLGCKNRLFFFGENQRWYCSKSDFVVNRAGF
jgi:hypothetical protein